MENWPQNGRFCIFDLNCIQILPFLHFKSSFGPPMPFEVNFWYWFVCTTTFSVHLWIYSVSNGKLASKWAILYFHPPICLKFAPFFTIKRSSNQNMAYKICGCYFFVYSPTQAIYLWSYRTSHAKLGLNLTIIVFFCYYDPSVRGNSTPWNIVLKHYFCTIIFRRSQSIYLGNTLGFRCN